MVDGFDEVRFPEEISYGAICGPEFLTDIVVLESGIEQRTQRWTIPRRRYEVSHALKSPEQLEELLRFFIARRGRLRGFRFKDWTDYRALNQVIGTGDGTAGPFQLVKRYTSGTETITRTISKPVQSTVVINVGGITKTENTDYTLDYTTGLVTFLEGHEPGMGAEITASFEFDVPVRFNTDVMRQSVEDYGIRSWSNIEIVELKLG